MTMFRLLSMISFATLVILSSTVAIADEPCPQFIPPRTSAIKWEILNSNLSENGVGNYTGINKFPSRRSRMLSWRGNDDSMYIFGGVVRYAGNSEFFVLNDMWHYNTNSAAWNLIHPTGENTGDILNKRAVYTGSQQPGSRTESAYWNDNEGNLWLYGGAGFHPDTGVRAIFSDVWKFTVASGSWEWVPSEGQLNPQSVIDTPGNFGTNPYPPARHESFFASDSSGNLWVFGGMNSDGKLLNDLWKYDVVSNQWTFYPYPGQVYSSNEIQHNVGGVYKAAITYPGSRYSGAAWTDSDDNFYIFGGLGYSTGLGALNDLWRFQKQSGTWEFLEKPGQLNSSNQFLPNQLPSLVGSDIYPGARVQINFARTSTERLILYADSGPYIHPPNIPVSGFLTDVWEYVPSEDRWYRLKENHVIEELQNHQPHPDSTGDFVYPGRKQVFGMMPDSKGNLLYFSGDNLDYSFNRSEVWRMKLMEDAVIINVTEGQTAQITPAIENDNINSILSIAEPPTKGSALITGGNSRTITYTANSGVFGDDTFSVKLTSPGCAEVIYPVKVKIVKVNPCSEAGVLNLSVERNVTKVFYVPGKALSYSDYTIEITQQPTLGTVVVGENGKVSYTTAQVSGTDTIRYKIKTETCESSESIISVQIGTDSSSVPLWELY